MEVWLKSSAPTWKVKAGFICLRPLCSGGQTEEGWLPAWFQVQWDTLFKGKEMENDRQDTQHPLLMSVFAQGHAPLHTYVHILHTHIEKEGETGDRERPISQAHTSNSRTWRQADQEFKAILNYTVSLTPAKNSTYFPALGHLWQISPVNQHPLHWWTEWTSETILTWPFRKPHPGVQSAVHTGRTVSGFGLHLLSQKFLHVCTIATKLLHLTAVWLYMVCLHHDLFNQVLLGSNLDCVQLFCNYCYSRLMFSSTYSFV